MMLSILVVTSNISPYPGGAEVYIGNLIQGLLNLGHKVTCVTENSSNIKDQNYTEVLVNLDVERIISKNTVTWRELQFSVINSIAELDDLRFDIVHANSMETCIIGSFIALTQKIPLVATIHEHNLDSRPFGRGIRKLIFEHLNISAFISPSSFYKDRNLKIASNESKVRYIPHGHKPILIEYKKKNYTLKINDQIRIISVGRIYKPKGFDILIEALSKLPTKKFSLDIFGPITDPIFYEKIRALSSKLRIKKNIKYHGSVLHRELIGRLKDYDLFISSSRHEGFGLSILEAMQVGLPVIAPNVGGIPDLISHEENGHLFTCGNPDSLAELIKSFVSGEILTEKTSLQAIKDAENKFSLQNMVQLTYKLYQEILKDWAND